MVQTTAKVGGNDNLNNDNEYVRKHRSTEVNLKEYLESRIDDDEELEIERWHGHEREHRDETQARELQAAEYARRLSELNQAHERAEKALTITVSREMFDQYVKESEKSTALALDTVRREVATERESRRAFMGALAVLAAIPGLIGLFLGVIQFIQN